MEQCLWKTTMYAVIEEFRRRIKVALTGGDETKETYLKVMKHQFAENTSELSNICTANTCRFSVAFSKPSYLGSDPLWVCLTLGTHKCS